MNEIICRSISNGREFEVPNDYFRSLHALRSECNSYTQAEARYTELLAEHDKQVRNDAIEEYRLALHKKYADNKYLYESNTEYWNLDMDEVDEIAGQLKGAEG